MHKIKSKFTWSSSSHSTQEYIFSEPPPLHPLHKESPTSWWMRRTSAGDPTQRRRSSATEATHILAHKCVQSITAPKHRRMKQHLTGVHLQGSLLHHSSMLTIQHQKNQLMLATQVLSKWDLLACSNLTALTGANPHLITHGAPGSKLQVSSGMLGTFPTTKGKIMKQPQVVIREDTCLSLAEGTTTSRRPTPHQRQAHNPAMQHEMASL
jgi:hypothetical protein